MKTSRPNPSPSDINEQAAAFDRYLVAFRSYHAHPTPLRFQAARVAMADLYALLCPDETAGPMRAGHPNSKRGRQ